MIKKVINQSRITDSTLEGVGSKRFIIYVISAALLGTSAFIAFNIYRVPMMFMFLGFVFVLIIVQIGYLSLARWLSVLMALSLVAFLMLTNLGIRDPIVSGLVVILTAASLMIGRKGILVIGILSLGIIAYLRMLDLQGYLADKSSEGGALSDYLTAMIIIIVAMVLEWLIISHTSQIFEKTNQKIDELEKTQSLLLEAEGRYRNLIEKMPVVIYIAEPGEAGVWHYISPHITAITGYTPAEWTENPNFWYSIVHPHDRLRVLEEERTVLSTGKLLKTEYRLFTKDGRIIWVYDESLLTVEGNDNQAVHGYILDITTRKEAEEQLSQRVIELETMRGVSEIIISKNNLDTLIEEMGEHIRLAFNASSIFIALHNPKTNLIHFPYDVDNGTRIADAPLQYGRGLTSKVMEMKRPLVINENWMQESVKYNAIYRNRKMAKSSIAVPMMIQERAIGVIVIDNTESEYAFSDNDIRLLTTIAANLAVTIENMRLQESIQQELGIQEKLVHQLEQKNEELERFAYTASHDLKAPLITIRGYLGYIEKDAQSGNFERLLQDTQRISDATDKMHRLLNELLELSRIGRVMNKAEEVPFIQIIDEALERIEGQIKEKQVQVKVQTEMPVLFVDKERMVEVLQNLIDNAVKFMGSQKYPKIEIGTQNRNNEIIYFVKDNGIGIKKEFHERIFGLFDKLDGASEGTGIGLALVKRIIEVHGGRIWVESEESKGTMFLFTLAGKLKVEGAS